MFSNNIQQLFFRILQGNAQRDEVEAALLKFKEEDWQELYDFAIAVEVFPAFYDKLLRLGFTSLPSSVISKFRDTYFLNVQRNIILERELMVVLNHLRAKNIKVITLKGPIFGRLFYGDTALRQASCDLDLLVGFDQIRGAQKFLSELGYNFHGRRPADF
ncbi:MAG: nucleotidyltransferase family protein, partial [Candidatus Omnitrophica bacterium]|nr:nucleotidyltransferase family protein [Candidatus Omnitrophota bacterium]